MIELRPVQPRDLERVASLHAAAFTDSAITALGHNAIQRYYAWLLEGPHDATLMGAWSHDRLVGFCAAGVFRGAMNGFLRKNRAYLAFHIATHPMLLWSPLVRDRIRRAADVTVRFSRRRQRAAAQAGNTPRPSFGVLAIATDPAARGSGAGRALMLEAQQRALAQGHARMTLTVAPTNARAVRFYEQLGWTRVGEPWTGSMERRLGDAT